MIFKSLCIQIPFPVLILLYCFSFLKNIDTIYYYTFNIRKIWEKIVNKLNLFLISLASA